MIMETLQEINEILSVLFSISWKIVFLSLFVLLLTGKIEGIFDKEEKKSEEEK